VFDGLFYVNIPRLSHNGMENPRTTVKKLHVTFSTWKARVPLEADA